MKYFIIGIVCLLILIFLIWYFLRKRWAIRKVKCTSDIEKLIYINAALNPFGFAFEPKCDIVISKNDVWQRDLGYTDLYDSGAPFLNMVMDAEPIYFDYDGKHYRIELWKGQYGITTGAEIGVYIRDYTSKNKNFYRAANDDERLNMSFILNKKCNLFSRCDKSWWLTGFDIGVFSRPKNLKMSICICFPNCKMLEAFVKALLKVGYSCCQINVCENTVCFEYCCPSNYKPNHKHRIIKCFAQICNYINCHIYMHFTRYFNRTIDKLTYLRFFSPCLYRLIIRLSIPRRKQKKHLKKVKK